MNGILISKPCVWANDEGTYITTSQVAAEAMSGVTELHPLIKRADAIKEVVHWKAMHDTAVQNQSHMQRTIDELLLTCQSLALQVNVLQKRLDQNNK